ncbi:hypothetical protein GYH30_012329 [Glycine max]|nr:hypothetical protein GYH30_012329 [Glycine max]
MSTSQTALLPLSSSSGDAATAFVPSFSLLPPPVLPPLSCASTLTSSHSAYPLALRLAENA